MWLVIWHLNTFKRYKTPTYTSSCKISELIQSQIYFLQRTPAYTNLTRDLLHIFNRTHINMLTCILYNYKNTLHYFTIKHNIATLSANQCISKRWPDQTQPDPTQLDTQSNTPMNQAKLYLQIWPETTLPKYNKTVEMQIITPGNLKNKRVITSNT